MNYVTKEIEIDKENGREHISFGIRGEILSNIFGFVTGINNRIPMKFYKDRIFIHLKSPDNIQYVEVEINSSDLLNYNPRLEYGNTEKNIVMESRRIKLEKINDIMNIGEPCTHSDLYFNSDFVSDFNTYSSNMGKDAIVHVKVFEEKIEFHLPGNIIIWAKLIKGKEMEDMMKTIERMPDIIKKARSNTDIKKASVILEQYWFNKIYCMKNIENNRNFNISIDKKEGFTLISKDKEGFYELKLKPKYSNIEPNEDGPIHVCINKDFLRPISKLVDLGPYNNKGVESKLKIEIRDNKPILIEKKLTSGISVMLTVAPRLNTEDTENSKEDTEILKF